MTPFSRVNSASPLEAAVRYREEGLHPVPLPYRTKKPVMQGWPNFRPTVDDLPKYFDSKPQNIGIILGDETGVSDVDCDVPEALVPAAMLLPETGMRFGRASKRESAVNRVRQLDRHLLAGG